MIKFYLPDGHLQDAAVGLFTQAGFKVRIKERAYNPSVDDPEILVKRLRPQDFPFLLSMGKGDVGITGSDIIDEYSLENPREAKDLEVLLPLGFGKTRLSVAVSKEVLPGVRSIKDFKKYADSQRRKGQDVVVATEYPNIVAKYLRKNRIKAVIQNPAGKTEAWATPPQPEADLIADTTETGRTLQANNCRILDDIMTAEAVLVANKKSLKDKAKKKKILELVQLFKGVLAARGKVNVYLNVKKPSNLEGVLKSLKKFVDSPTVSALSGGGFDVFIIIDEKDLKYILPQLQRKGASGIAISDTRMIVE